MVDFIDYFDFKKFKNQRYIIRVTSDVNLNKNQTDIPTHIQHVGAKISKKQEKHFNLMLKQIQTFEKSTKSMMKAQKASLIEVKKLIQT